MPLYIWSIAPDRGNDVAKPRSAEAQPIPSEGLPFSQRLDPAVRARLTGPALRTFFNIAREWSLSVDPQRTLLGGVPASTYYKWKAKGGGTLSYDPLGRISLGLGIYKALKLLFADDASGLRLLKAADTQLRVWGASPVRRVAPGRSHHL